MEQRSIDNKMDGWVELERPKDESFVKLEVDEVFVGRYASSKDNPNFPDEKIHVFQLLDSDDIKQFNGTVDFDRWISILKPGDIVFIRRLENQNLPNVNGKIRKPMQVYKFWKKKEKSNESQGL